MTHPLRLLCLSVLTASSLALLPMSALAQGFDREAPLPSQAAINAQFSSSADLERYRNQLENSKAAREAQINRIAGFERDIAGLSAMERTLRGQLERSNSRIAELNNQKRELDTQISNTQAQIKDLESQIVLTEARVARQRAAVNALLVRMFKNKSGEFVKLIARAETLHDLLLRAQYANKLSSADLELIASLKLNIQELDGQRQNLVLLTERLNTLQRQLMARLDDMKIQQRSQQTAIAGLQRSKAGRSALLLETARAQQRTEAQMQTLLGNVVQERGRLESVRQARLQALAVEKARRIEEARQIALERARLARLAAEAQARRIAAEKVRLEQVRVAQERVAARKLEAQREQQREQRRIDQRRVEERLVVLKRDQIRQQEALRQANQQREQSRALASAQQEAELRVANARAENARADEARLKREQDALEARQSALTVQQKQDDREAVQTRASLSVPSAYRGNLGFPMPGGRVSSGFNGSYVLISGGDGAAVQATGEGVVLQIYYYAAQGGVIVIQHSDGLQSLYFGLQSPTVSAGSRVSSGQIIGYAGGSPSYGTNTMGYQVTVQSIAINPL